MKLSYSTRGWRGKSWQEFCDIATEMEFGGIELHNIHDPIFTGPNGIFDATMTASTKRKLIELGLSIPCIDSVCNIADADAIDENCAEIEDCIAAAAALRIPNVRIHATAVSCDDPDEVITQKCTAVLRLLEKRERFF